ncbi:uncharacterized protein LOC124133438 [Haliotis rufescens]|uniref:uncharacterized protein LOC124133438 n=1 Tax=Haliotis rufescens TaxID=6454 RepID=UPI00201F80A9|nr:uncharacterized protein LOC124133438 [Haliotis rufescens]
MNILGWLVLCVSIKGSSSACSSCSNIAKDPNSYHSVSYHSSDARIENPGRGFYQHLETTSSHFSPLTVHYLDTVRRDDGVNIGLRIYVLDSFVHSSISNTFLTHIRDDLDIVKDAGWTVALRFSYTSHSRSTAPYGDATKQWMLEHIRQLGPIWKAYEGVISVIQAGFIGIWGEWYYTTYFGDPNHLTHGLSATNWQDRRDVLTAIIDNSPTSIPVQVRTPTYKMKIWNSNRPSSLADVERHTHAGRTGHHNDCFLASDDDVGTYENVATEKSYLAIDTEYLPIGGETCGRAPSKHGSHRSDCPTALKELKQFHWSFINKGYSPEVTGDWKSQGCFVQIHRDLGYRLSLKQAVFPTKAEHGGTLCFHLVLSNTGYAAPYKPWTVKLILKANSGGGFYSASLPNVDVREWTAGHDHAVDGSIGVPPSVHGGSYKAYLAIYDEKMKTHADYYVLLANTDVPDFAAGINDLKATVQVTGSGTHAPTGCPTLSPWTPPSRSKYSRVFGKDSVTSHQSCQKITVPNNSFENGASDKTWLPYHGGFTVTTSGAHSGSHAISVTNGGASHLFTFSPPIHSFLLTAYSKHSGTSLSNDPSDYSVYCDITRPDGQRVWGKYAPFHNGVTTWQRVDLRVHVSEGISQAHCYLLYRNIKQGSALFDDVAMWSAPQGTDVNDC